MIDRNGKKIYNCPNCAAPIGYGPKCEYCGTVLRWIPTCEVKKVYVNVRKLVAKISVSKALLERYPGTTYVTERLRNALAWKLPEVWTVSKRDHPFARDEWEFRAEILIGREDNG